MEEALRQVPGKPGAPRPRPLREGPLAPGPWPRRPGPLPGLQDHHEHPVPGRPELVLRRQLGLRQVAGVPHQLGLPHLHCAVVAGHLPGPAGVQEAEVC